MVKNAASTATIIITVIGMSQFIPFNEHISSVSVMKISAAATKLHFFLVRSLTSIYSERKKIANDTVNMITGS